jgi:hypothetical protein
MGSYRLTVKSLHLNRNLDFTRLMLETVKKSLHHSCTSSIKWQGISLPLDRQSYSRRLLRIFYENNYNWYKFINLDLQYWAGIRFNTSYYNFAESCVFEKQSLLSCKCPFQKQNVFKKDSIFRSYGAILPSSFNIIILITLVYFTYLPVSVFGTIYEYNIT